MMSRAEAAVSRPVPVRSRRAAGSSPPRRGRTRQPSARAMMPIGTLIRKMERHWLPALGAAPSNLYTLRVSEGMLAILLAGGIDPQTATWAIDSLTLYVNAYSLEVSLVNNRLSHSDDNWVVSRDELLRRFAALPDTFPQTKRYAAELTAGTGHDRFDFTIGLMIDGLVTPHSRLPDHAAWPAR